MRTRGAAESLSAANRSGTRGRANRDRIGKRETREDERQEDETRLRRDLSIRESTSTRMEDRGQEGRGSRALPFVPWLRNALRGGKSRNDRRVGRC